MTSHRRIWAFPRRRRILGGSTPSIVRRTGSNWLTPVYPPHEIVRRLPNNWGVNPPLTWFPYICRPAPSPISGIAAQPRSIQTSHVLECVRECWDRMLGQIDPSSLINLFQQFQSSPNSL